MPSCFKHRVGQARHTGAVIWGRLHYNRGSEIQQMLTCSNWNHGLSHVLRHCPVLKETSTSFSSISPKQEWGEGGAFAPFLNGCL